MPGRPFLFVPGPTNVPDRIMRAMHRAMLDHRSSSFPELTRSVLDRLPQVFGLTGGECFVFACSGTGMWEAALTNTLNAGDKLLAVRFGQFSHLFVQNARALGYEVDVIEAPWGDSIPVDKLEEALANDTRHRYKGVLAVHNETATGVTADIGAVRSALNRANHPALLFVDGISSIGSLEFKADEWGVDLAIAGSQKGFMMPAGLGIVAVSAKAKPFVDSATSPRAYFDMRPMRVQNALGSFPYTPALSHLFGMDEALNMMEEEGLPNVYARHAYLASGARQAVKAWGLKLCAVRPELYSNTVSAIMMPEGVDAAKVINHAYSRYELSLGAGLGELGGKAFRIGHLGDLNPLMLSGALAGVEMALNDAGVNVELGSGVGAALKYWRANAAAARAS
ncbi:MAG: aminotransferase class V-fold PLP-dependent enzyme [Phycisphaerae bacterium]|nr:aminotransferase class V-fold PLP-dependent enzyme [Gemmatimonadaceae bacterium]